MILDLENSLWKSDFDTLIFDDQSVDGFTKYSGFIYLAG